MVWKDFLSNEDDNELNEILDLNQSIEEKLEMVINFFQKISSQYEIEAFVECFSSFITQEFHDLNSRLISIFFMEVFGLRALEHYGSEEYERNYVILPALSLSKLKERKFEIEKIIGGFLQLDHEGDMSYQLSGVIDYLLENALIGMQDIENILQKIILHSYASYVRVGRFLGILIEFNILKVTVVIELIQSISSALNLNIKQISEIMIGTNRALSSSNVGKIIYEKILNLKYPDLKFLTDPTYISDQATGLSIIISNYLYESKSIFHIINLIIKNNAKPVLAEAFKYLIDNSIINLKRLGFLLRNEFSNGRFDYSILSSLISINFSYIEISKLLASIIGKGFDIINKKNFIAICNGFYNTHYHGLDNSKLKKILQHLYKINPEILDSFEINDIDKFLVDLSNS